MVRILRFFAYFSFLIMALIYFSPKNNMYYLLEKELKSESLIVNNELVNDKGFTLNIKNATILTNSILIAEVMNIDFNFFIFYNSININTITLNEISKSLIPLNIQKVDIYYSIVNPLNILLSGEGEFGKFKAKFNMLNQILDIKLEPSKLMKSKYKNTLRKFKKSENGEYIYEKTI